MFDVRVRHREQVLARLSLRLFHLQFFLVWQFFLSQFWQYSQMHVLFVVLVQLASSWYIKDLLNFRCNFLHRNLLRLGFNILGVGCFEDVYRCWAHVVEEMTIGLHKMTEPSVLELFRCLLNYRNSLLVSHFLHRHLCLLQTLVHLLRVSFRV